MNDIDRPGWRRRAIEVRDEHADGKRCEECPAEPLAEAGRCRRWATWFPVIAELKAGR